MPQTRDPRSDLPLDPHRAGASQDFESPDEASAVPPPASADAFPAPAAVAESACEAKLRFLSKKLGTSTESEPAQVPCKAPCKTRLRGSYVVQIRSGYPEALSTAQREVSELGLNLVEWTPRESAMFYVIECDEE